MSGRGSVPAVVLVDHARWHVLDQLAAVVRRSGFRSIRVSVTPAGWITRLVDRLVYSRGIYLTGVRELARLPELLHGENVVEMHVTEVTGEALAGIDLAGLPHDVVAELRRREPLLDKLRVADLGREHDLDVPPVLVASASSAAEAADALGLPMVVKGRIGASGDSVAIVESVEDAERALARLGSVEDLYFEKYVPGDIVAYSALLGRDGVVQELTYEATSTSADPTMPPLDHQIVDDPAMTAMGRAACAAFGVRGPINIQAMRDAEGRHWMIDVNARPFSPMLCFPQDQVDTVRGYLFVTGLGQEPPVRRTAPAGTVAFCFPADAEDLAAHGRPLAAARAFARRAPRFAPVFGVRYVVFALASRVARRLGH